MRAILVRGKPQSIHAPALLVKIGRVEVARVILASWVTRVEFNVYVPPTCRPAISLVRFLNGLARENGSRLEVREDVAGWLDHVDILPPLKKINVNLLVRKIRNAVALALQEGGMMVVTKS